MKKKKKKWNITAWLHNTQSMRPYMEPQQVQTHFIFHAKLTIADNKQKGGNVGGDKLGRAEQSWNDEFGMDLPNICCYRLMWEIVTDCHTISCLCHSKNLGVRKTWFFWLAVESGFKTHIFVTELGLKKIAVLVKIAICSTISYNTEIVCILCQWQWIYYLWSKM